MQCHFHEMHDLPAIAALMKEAARSGGPTAVFVDAMQLRYINLSCADRVPVMFDYGIEPGHSDLILAVEFHLDGTVSGVKWES